MSAPIPEHVAAGAALRRMDEAADALRRAEATYAISGMVVDFRAMEAARKAYQDAVAAYYGEGVR